jgi:2,4-dienoyl-CoA reductase-like NADH-dependent reductase (Old Yellow Enzyme family)
MTGKPRATQHDVLTSYKDCITNAKLYLNGDVTPDEGVELINAKKIDGIAIGTLWVTHPDVGSRIKHNKPLDNNPDYPTMQIGRGTEETWSIGYTDYPAAAI